MEAGRLYALVTGGSAGIGLAVAKRLKAEGIDVITPARRDMDLLSDASIDAYLKSLSRPVDILINNAGVNIIAPLADITDDYMRETIQINLLAPFRLARALAPGMAERRYGRIVNISSIWAYVSKPGRLTYATAKSGLQGMTRTLAVELAPYNVLVNVIAPGFVNTEMTRRNNTREQIEAIEKNIPAGRLAEPEEIAEATAFLASEKNSYITGQTILVDGGFTCL